jgi:hypothetical protein
MVSAFTFAERLYNCTSFKQDKNYEQIIRNVSIDIIKQNRNSGKDCKHYSFFSILSEKFNRWSASLELILKNDKESVEDILIQYSENLSKFFNRFDIDTSIINYVYKGKINGFIYGSIMIDGKMYNIDISFKNTSDTFYHLYYYKLNFFLYNKVHGLNNDGLVYVVCNDSLYHIKYDANDYTTGKGFVDYNINNRMIRPGHQCLYCSIKNCKPRLITDINRFINQG